MKLISTFLKAIKSIYRFLLGTIIGCFLYEKQYMKSRYFKGPYGKVGAVGYKWTLDDFHGRRQYHRNVGIRWPVSPYNQVLVSNGKIEFDIDDLHIFQGSGKYIQASFGGNITIGKGTWIANNVGIVTSNHKIDNLEDHEKGKDVNIGMDCWIGMNAVILPGVQLGNHTIVGAGSIVTESFPKGHSVLAGNPAKIVRTLLLP